MSLRVLSSLPAFGAVCRAGVKAASLLIGDSTAVANGLWCRRVCQQRAQRAVHERGTALYMVVREGGDRE